MVIPVGIAFLVLLPRRLERDSSGGQRRPRPGVRASWLGRGARDLPAPPVGAVDRRRAVLVMLVAHVATGSRGGAAALLAGLGVMAAGAIAGKRRWVGAVLALALVVGSAAALGAWATAEEKAGVDTVDASLAARLAVGVRATALIGDHPLFGTGLGSWLEAFRPYQQPPVEGGIWDHAHDDYLELTAETGAAGVAIALLFAIAVCRGIRRNAPLSMNPPADAGAADPIVSRLRSGARRWMMPACCAGASRVASRRSWFTAWSTSASRCRPTCCSSWSSSACSC